MDVVLSDIWTLLPDARETTVAMGPGDSFFVGARINELCNIIELGTIEVGRFLDRALVCDIIPRIESPVVLCVSGGCFSLQAPASASYRRTLRGVWRRRYVEVSVGLQETFQIVWRGGRRITGSP